MWLGRLGWRKKNTSARRILSMNLACKIESRIFDEARRVKRMRWADSAGKGRNISKSMLRMEGVLNSKSDAAIESIKK